VYLLLRTEERRHNIKKQHNFQKEMTKETAKHNQTLLLPFRKEIAGLLGYVFFTTKNTNRVQSSQLRIDETAEHNPINPNLSEL
jgi:hypothetical protein